jgi:hypothetical protein
VQDVDDGKLLAIGDSRGKKDTIRHLAPQRRTPEAHIPDSDAGDNARMILVVRPAAASQPCHAEA